MGSFTVEFLASGMEGLRAGWVSHGRGGAVLYELVEQSRHEHMSDKYKN